MRKILEYTEADESIIEQMKALIESIADHAEDAEDSLNKINQITGKVHEQYEFEEYWGWTDAGTLARQILTMPPIVKDLTKDEITEIVQIIKDTIVSGEEVKEIYYEELLYKSLPLIGVAEYIDLDKDNQIIAEEMMQASRNGVIYL